MSDDLTQQLGDVVAARMDGYEATPANLARAVLASGLVVPASDLLDLAQQWDDMASAGDSAAAWFATELRALTQQENK